VTQAAYKNKSKNPKRKLRCGFTTGAAAAAAAKGALLALCSGGRPVSVEIAFLTGEPRRKLRRIDMHRLERLSATEAICTVIKDAGDDPDVTHKAEIGVRLRLDRDRVGRAVAITGGRGVGTVTKPGLDVAVGEAAINPGPRKMIRQSIEAVFKAFPPARPVVVEVFIPGGVALARKTLNARLGILGGLSVLGTTGIVSPVSHRAYMVTIEKALGVARAAGLEEVVLTTGRRSERFAHAHLNHLPEEGLVQIGDFFQKGLTLAAAAGFSKVTLAVFFGKAVKQARGVPHTHAAKARQTLETLARWTREETGDTALGEVVEKANTARHAFDLLMPYHPAVIARVGREMLRQARKFAGDKLAVNAMLFDYAGRPIFHVEADGGEKG
jgi:cobalt-precorrin-5B (C1)-methyltransferase